MNFDALEKRYGLPAGMLAAVQRVESGGNPMAVSPKGAQGLFQIMPGTAKELGVDPLNPAQAADGAARYLAQNLKRFGSPELALAAYNAGPGNVQKHNGIPPFKETQDYVRKVQANMGKPTESGPWEDYQDESGPWEDYAQKSPKQSPGVLPETGGFAAAVGGALMDIPLGLKQRFDQGAAALEKRFGGESINKALGMKNASDIERETQAKIIEKRKIDAPMLATTAGKWGNFTGKALPAFLTALTPGGLPAAMATGGGLGFAEPTTKGESAAKNTALGIAGGGVGYLGGQALGTVANKVIDKAAASKAANAAKDFILKQARSAGYVVPPTQANPTIMNRIVEGLAGKISTGQGASIKNQQVTNRAAARALGLDESQPITKEALSGLRAEAGKAYEQIKAVGTLKADAQYKNALNSITKKYQGAAKDFPELAKTDIDDIVSAVNKKQFDSDSAVDAIAILRERATAAYGKGDKSVGKAYREASEALESLIERNLQESGNRGLLKSFRNARELIAKSYSVESALNSSTGNVAARKLATQLSKGKPLSGDLKKVAQFAQAFPKAADEVTSSMPGLSPLDYIGAGLLSGSIGTPVGMLAAGARPLARSLLLSKPYQAINGAPSYSKPITELLGSNPSRAALQAGLLTYPNWAQ